MTAEEQVWGACVSNLRAPSNDSDLLDPLERLREQREQVPPAAHDVLRHENRSRTKQIKSYRNDGEIHPSTE